MPIYFIYLTFKSRTKKWLACRYMFFITFILYMFILSFIWVLIGKIILFLFMPQILNIELASGYILPFLLGMSICLPFTSKMLMAVNGFWSWLTDTSWIDGIIAEGKEIYLLEQERKLKISEPSAKETKKRESNNNFWQQGALTRGDSSSKTVYFSKKRLIGRKKKGG